MTEARPRPRRGLSLRAKVLGSYVGVLLVFGTVLGFALLQMAETRSNLSSVAAGYMAMSRESDRVAGLPLGYALDHDGDDWLRYRPNLDLLYLDQMERNLAAAAEHAAVLQGKLESPVEFAALAEVQDQVAGVASLLIAYRRGHEQLAACADRDDAACAALTAAALRGQRREITEQLDLLRTKLEIRIGNALETAGASQLQASRRLLWLSSTAIALAGVMFLLVHLSLRPIERLTRGAQRIAEGRYDGQVEVGSHDEIGTLAEEFNRMAASLADRDTELRRSIAELDKLGSHNQSIVRSIAQGLLVIDESGTIASGNPAAETLWGVALADVVGRPWRDVTALAPIAEAVDRALRGPAGAELAGVEVVDDAGTRRVLDVELVPQRHRDGTVIGLIAIASDVTDKLAAENRLLQMERLATVGRMSAQVAHEIRNPLNALGLNAELLGDELDGLPPGSRAEARELLAQLQGEIDRLAQVTETYLSLARMPRPELEQGDLGALVDSVLDFLADELQQARLAVHADTDAAVPSIAMDHNQLRQALLNLVRNAVEAQPDGGELRVSLEAADGGVALTVADRGPGVEPALRESIFDPFVSSKERGTGLGLAITRQIVEAHGGRIRCLAAADRGEPSADAVRGAVFRVWLPAADDGKRGAAARVGENDPLA